MKGFLKTGALALLVLVLPALMGIAAPKYREAPMLARLVAQGKLPPVDKRLPDVPMVAGPGVLNGMQWVDWTVGKYSDGKVARVAALTYKDILLGIDYNILWAPDQTTKNPIPVLVEKFSFSPDYKVYDFTIRKGLKWSNGDEVTTEDVRFTFEDLYQYTDSGIAYPSSLHSQGNMKYPVAKLAIKDKYSFTLTFDRSYGFYIADLTSWITECNWILQPSKFLKGYHPKYTAVAALDAMAKKAGLDGWKQLLRVKTDTHWTAQTGSPYMIGVPSLQPYVLVSATDTLIRAERNPYYCWVDTQGQQLPYIDAHESTVIKDKDALTVKIISGGVDYIMDDFARLPMMPLYLLGADKSDYHVQISGGFNGPPLLIINQDYDYENPNSQWQKLVQDPQHRFSKAVALAIDKNDANNTLYFGKYKMNNLVTTSDFDPAKANQLLNEIGLNKKDANGFRTYPDGSPLLITIMNSGASPDQIDMSQLIAKYLQAVGINVNAKQLERGIFNQKASNNEFQMTVSWKDGPGWPSGISQDYLPGEKGCWAPASAKYIDSQGTQGRKPPAYIQEFYDIHTKRKEVPPQSPEGEVQYAKLLKWFADNYVLIWPVGSIIQPVVVGNNLRNFPKDNYSILYGILAGAPGWYFDQP